MSFVNRLKLGSSYLGPQAPLTSQALAVRAREAITGEAVPPVPMYNRGALGWVINKGERVGTALALGFAKGAWREKTLWGGRPMEMWLGLGLTGAAAALKIQSMGTSRLAPHIEAIGDTALVGWLQGVGVNWGTDYAASKGAPKPIPAHKVAGDLPVEGTKFLTPDQVAHWTAPRA